MQNFIISKAESNQTLIKYLNRLLPNTPGGLIYKQLRNKNILLNEKKANGNEKVKEGDEVKIFMSDETISKFKGEAELDISEYINAYNKYKEPEVIYEDEHVLIINKPVGMLSQKANPTDISVNEWLLGYLIKHEKISVSSLSNFKPSICNRLDRNTGGLLIFGKTLFGNTRMNELLRNRDAHKYYRTIVYGHIIEAKKLKGYLVKDTRLNKVSISNNYIEGSEQIETEYYPLRYSKENDITELEVKLITGKPHQIRAHLASINHPILGDSKYKASYNNAINLKHQLLYAVRFELPFMDDYMELSEKKITLNTDKIFDKYFTN